MWMWPELPGWPCIGFAMKHGVMPCLIPMDLANSLRISFRFFGPTAICEKTYLNSAALSAISFTGDAFRAWNGLAEGFVEISRLPHGNSLLHIPLGPLLCAILQWGS